MSWELAVLAALCFFQSATFTWSGRSRTSGDVAWHGLAAIFSNGTYFVVTVTIWKSIWEALTTSDWSVVLLTGIVYVFSTAAGSMSMMSLMLKTEKGARRVGHNGN